VGLVDAGFGENPGASLDDRPQSPPPRGPRHRRRLGWGIGRSADIGARGGTDEQKEARTRHQAG
jgi:hypothetical protein